MADLDAAVARARRLVALFDLPPEMAREPFDLCAALALREQTDCSLDWLFGGDLYGTTLRRRSPRPRRAGDSSRSGLN
jgi:hypothetical protein